MKNRIALLCLLLFAFLYGCSGQQQAQEGYVFEVMEGKVLVLNPISKADLGKKWNDIMLHYQGQAIVLQTREKLQVGQKIRYWIKGEILESHPAQAKASKIEIVQP
jgi:hypothetical protein